MARYNTPVRDWTVRMPASLRRPSRDETTEKTIQQGVTVFSRKKKNGSRLTSTRVIKATTIGPKGRTMACGSVFPKIAFKNSKIRVGLVCEEEESAV